MRLSRFNNEGINAFQAQLHSFSEGAVVESPLELIGQENLI